MVALKITNDQIILLLVNLDSFGNKTKNYCARLHLK